MVDKNLFLYDLAVVAILKNEAPYLKEWLDYHLLAGVDHFFLYDNDSPDNQSEVVAPYVAAGLVDYFSLPGKVMQAVAYNDAPKRFKFFSRYMTFIDGDEFIFPKSNRSVVEVVDEILSGVPNAAGVAVNIHNFGSNGHDKADYSRGVLERFTRRAPSNWIRSEVPRGNQLVSSILNPRAIKFLPNPHCAIYLENFFAVNENGDRVPGYSNEPVTAEKIVMNHYNTKSREEYRKKIERGMADKVHNVYDMKFFEIRDRNEVFDDGILKYRAAREKNFSLEDAAKKFSRVTEALIENLSAEKISLEAALTCRALSSFLLKKFPRDKDSWKICEEKSLEAILKSLSGINFSEAQLFVRELPNLLNLPYPAAKEIRVAASQIISQMKEIYRLNGFWKDFVEADYLQDFFKEEFGQ